MDFYVVPMVKLLLILSLAFWSPIPALASEDGTGTTEPYGVGFDFKDTRFSIGIAAAALRYDTQLEFVDKDSGRSIFVDAEGTLGLPDTDVSPAIFGRYRFSRRHSLGFSYWSLKRSNTLVSPDFDIGDLEVSGVIEVSDRSHFYYLNYSYTFMEDSRSKIFGVLGLYGLDVKYAIEAEGQIFFDGELIAEDSFTRTASAFAPLPMVGIDAIFAVTPRWSFGTKVMLIGGSVGDVRDALVLDTSVRAQYMFNESLGLHFGIKYFNADFDVDKSSVRSKVSYGFDGVFGGLSLTI